MKYVKLEPTKTLTTPTKNIKYFVQDIGLRTQSRI